MTEPASSPRTAPPRNGPHWPDARGWIGIGAFSLTVMVMWMIVAFPELRKDEFFKVIATAIVLTGWNGGVMAWAYSATKGGGELADRNATLVEAQAAGPVKAEIVNPPSKPVPVSDGGAE